MVPGEKPVEERCPYTSDVQGASGAGSKADSNMTDSTHCAVNSLPFTWNIIFYAAAILYQNIRLIKRKFMVGAAIQ